MKFIGILILFNISVSISTQAQTAEDSVKITVNNLFIAMKSADANLLRSCFADSAMLQTIGYKNGETAVRTEPVSEFADFIGKEEKGSADERIDIEAVKIDGKLAIVWAPYKFYYKEKFSHCGVNSFQLVRFASGWKIQYLIDTRRKTGCDNQ